MSADYNPIKYDDKKIIDTVKNTIAKGASDAEFQLFWNLCKSAKLDPFKKEIWLVPTRQGAQIMIGINGYLAIANSNESFNGMEVDTYRDEKGNPVEAVCKVHRKDRDFPSVGRAIWKEDSKNGPIWREKPTLMLEKVAKARAIREAFPTILNGTYIEDEMPDNYGAKEKPQVVEVKEVKPEPAPKPETFSKAQYCFVYDVFAHVEDREERERLYKLFREYDGQYCKEDKLWYSAVPVPELEQYATEETKATIAMDKASNELQD